MASDGLQIVKLLVLLTVSTVSGMASAEADDGPDAPLLLSDGVLGPQQFACLLELATQSRDGERLPSRIRVLAHRDHADFRVHCLDDRDRLLAVFFRKGAFLVDRDRPGKVLAVDDLWLGLSVLQKGIPIFTFGKSAEPSKFLIDRAAIFKGRSGDFADIVSFPRLVRSYAAPGREIREMSIAHGHQRNVVAIEGTQNGQHSFQLMRLLSLGESYPRGAKPITPGNREWTQLVSRRISFDDLEQPPVDPTRIDDDPRYTAACDALANLVGLTDRTLLARFAGLAEDSAPAEFAKVLQSLLNDGFMLNRTIDGPQNQQSPHVVRSCYRAHLELSVGSRFISRIVQRLLNIVEQDNEPSVRGQALYLLSRLGLSASEARRLDSIRVPADLHPYLVCVKVLSGLPVGDARWQSRPASILQALLQIETAFLMQQPADQATVETLLTTPKLPVCAAERERILVMLLRTVGQVRRVCQAVLNQSCTAFTAEDCVMALHHSHDPERWASNKATASVIIKLCDRVASPIRAGAGARQIRTEALKLMGSVSVSAARDGARRLLNSRNVEDHRVALEGSNSGWFTRDEYAILLKKAADSDSSTVRQAAMASSTGAVAERVRAKQDFQIPFLILVRSLKDSDQRVRKDALAALVILSHDLLDVPDAVLERAIGILDNKPDPSELKLIASLIRQNTPFFPDWPPLRNELPVRPFEDEDQWWARNRNQLIPLLKNVLKRAVAMK